MSASDFPHPSLPSHSQHLLLPHVRHISPPFLCRGVKHYTPSTRLCSLSSVPFLSTSTSFSPASLPIVRPHILPNSPPLFSLTNRYEELLPGTETRTRNILAQRTTRR
ncbi:hypothetical protein B0H13DRAFT_2336561 [Mycena leptocephala]|nr:hypothetical protein B0H13DRAFT_2336561 [Mycena leptocephala]